MELANCPNKSEYIYSWGSKIMHGCHRHANAMKAIAGAIGAPFSAEPDIAGMLEHLMCDHKDDLEEAENGDA